MSCQVAVEERTVNLEGKKKNAVSLDSKSFPPRNISDPQPSSAFSEEHPSLKPQFMARFLLILSDFIISFLWVWSGALIKNCGGKILGFGPQPRGEIIMGALYVLAMFFFAWLGKITRGGTYNPVTVLPSAISGNFCGFLFVVGARIPAQVAGSIIGVKFITETFPEVGRGPRLNVDIHRGALTEGLFTFAIVIISLGVAKNDPNNFFIKTWITSVSKLAFRILGSDLTGGYMNPASAIGWAYARGGHTTKEYFLVYCLAPIEATLLGVWTFKLLLQPQKQKQKKERNTDKSIIKAD